MKSRKMETFEQKEARLKQLFSSGEMTAEEVIDDLMNPTESEQEKEWREIEEIHTSILLLIDDLRRKKEQFYKKYGDNKNG
jgi:polyhydroxyalkanoate synthesis regulator phasin